MSYDDFKKDVLYAVARNGGSLYEDSLPKPQVELDRLDFHLHLQQLRAEKLVTRSWSQATPAGFDVFGLPARQSKPYLELTNDGWEWVREDRSRAAETTSGS